MNNTNEQVKQEQVESKAKKFSKKAMIMTGIALTGVAAVAIKVIIIPKSSTFIFVIPNWEQLLSNEIQSPINKLPYALNFS